MSDDSNQKLLDRLDIPSLIYIANIVGYVNAFISCIHLILSFGECDGLKGLNYE